MDLSYYFIVPQLINCIHEHIIPYAYNKHNRIIKNPILERFEVIIVEKISEL